MLPRHDSTLYHGLFKWHANTDGEPRLSRCDTAPAVIPCPSTGRPLRIATVDVNAPAICPACSSRGQGGFVSFVGDLRMAYACPQCRVLIWLAGV